MKYLQKFSLIHQIAHWNALVSFFLGTVIFVCYLVSKENTFVEIGIYYLGYAFWWNCFVLAVVTIAPAWNNTGIASTLKTIAALLLNIPIAFIYFLIVINIGS